MHHLEVNEQSAALLESKYDVIIVNDPQPAAIRHFAGQRGAKWIWRCHIDSSAPDESVRSFSFLSSRSTTLSSSQCPPFCCQDWIGTG